MSRTFTTALEVGSAAAVTAGAALWNGPLGFVVGGAFGLLFARGAAR